MKKTVTINISGIIFHIEEDAYEKLKSYLNQISNHFSSGEEGVEIVSDIESRIAELLQEKIKPSKQVVTMLDVEDLIRVMGKPEQFTENSDPETETIQQTSESSKKIKKRLFRDTDNKILGGVCAGVSAYFGLDVVWIRLILVLLTLLGFSGILVYIIFWIVVPEAQTTMDKLQMRGEAVDVNNISKSIKEESEQIRKNVTKFGRNAKEKFSSTGNVIAARIGNFLIKLIGLFLVLTGVGLVILFVVTAVGVSIAGNENLTFRELISGLFPNNLIVKLSKIAILLLIGVPILSMLYAGIKLLFSLKYKNSWLNISGTFIWIIGIIMSLYIFYRCYDNFKTSSSCNVYQTIKPNSDTLFVGLDLKQKYNQTDVLIADNLSSGFIQIEGEDMMIEGDRKIFLDGIKLNIILSKSDSFEIQVVKTARGNSERNAKSNSHKIKYDYKIFEKELYLNSFFYVAKSDPWRNQEVIVYLKVPNNKVIYLDKSLFNILNEADNIHEVFEEDMVGRKWRMSTSGLECIDCVGLLSKKDKRGLSKEIKKELKNLKEEIKNEMN